MRPDKRGLCCKSQLPASGRCGESVGRFLIMRTTSAPAATLLRCLRLATLGGALWLGGSLRAESTAPILRSVLIDGQASLFSLADAAGTARWVGLGSEFDGWKLESYDAEAQKLTLRRGEETRAITLANSVIQASGSRAASLAEADALLQQIRFEEMIEAGIRAQQSAMMKSMSGLMGGRGGDAEQSRLAALQKRVMDVMLAEMDLPSMRQDMAKAYAELFTADELKAQADFYSTPAGRAMLEKQPELQAKISESMMPRLMRAMPKVQAAAMDFAKEQAPAAATPLPAPAAP